MTRADRRPTLHADSGRLFVCVPSARADALRQFLRSHGVSAAHPEPMYTGTDSMEVSRGTGAKAVQALLDEWPG
jgi:hypothetical protein